MMEFKTLKIDIVLFLSFCYKFKKTVKKYDILEENMQNRDDDESRALKQFFFVAYILLPTYRTESYNNMLTNIVLFNTIGSTDQTFFSEEVHIAYQNTWKEV